MAGRFFIGLSVAALGFMMLTGIGCWGLWAWRHDVVVWVMFGEALAYAAFVWFMLRHEKSLDPATTRRAVLLILVVAGAMRLMLIFPPPVSTDIYRYVWDGRVQAAGINAYRYRPADPALTALRDRAIYPYINRKTTATTIYPPMAQAIFLAVTRLAESLTVMKAAMAAFDMVTIWAILGLLRRRGLPETRVLLYAWHPLPVFEFAGSGHIDAAAIAFMLLASLAAERRHPALAGLLLAGGALVKYFPAVILPALYRRWDWRLPAAALVTAVLLYLPYIGVGWQVLGFLPGYTQQEHLASGSGFFLLGLLGRVVTLPQAAVAVYLALGLAALAGVALAALLRRQPETVALGAALLLLSIFLVCFSPHLDWYFAWVIPFLCFRPASPALIYLTGAAPLLYNIVWAPGKLPINATLYIPFALILLLEIVAGARRPTLEVFDHGHSDRADQARPPALSRSRAERLEDPHRTVAGLPLS